MGRGGACVPARVALQGRIHHLFPRIIRDTQTYFSYGNAHERHFSTIFLRTGWRVGWRH